MPQTRFDQILDYAEREMRRNGFDAVSFRDIAAAIGIKSASVHYHFPTKADLGARVTKRYAERFLEALGEPDDASETTKDRIRRLAEGYIAAYRQDSSTCLCAVLGSVVSHVPDETAKEVQLFYEDLSEWVATALAGANTPLKPNLIIGMLQGAMVLAIATGDDKPLFDAKNYLIGAV